MINVLFKISDILSLIIVYQAVHFSVLLIFDKSKRLEIRWLLWMFMLTIGLNFLFILIMNQGIQTRQLGPALGLIYGPLFFLFGEFLIDRARRLSLNDLLHFVPSILVLLVLLVQDSFLMRSTVNLIVTIAVGTHLAIYLFSTHARILAFQRELKDYVSNTLDMDLAWLKLMIRLFGLLLILIVLQAGLFNSMTLQNAVLVGLQLFVLIFMSLLYYKGFLHLARWAKIPYPSENLAEDKNEKYASNKLDKDEIQKLADKVVAFIEKDKPYKNDKLSLNDVSLSAGIDARSLSQVINVHFETNFYDFINGYRIQAAIAQLQTSSDKRINEIMYSVGFNSKSSFNTAFKKRTGQTPSEFRKTQQKGSNT